MVGVFVAFIRVVYGRMIYMSLPLPAIGSGMDIVLLTVSVVVSKPFDTGTTRPISCRDTSYPFLGHLAPSFEMDFISSICFYQTHIDMFIITDLFS